MRRRAVTTVLTIVVVLGTLVVGADAGPAAAASTDQYQSVAITTTPVGSVTVGGAVDVDVRWTNRTQFPFTAFGIDITIPNGFFIDGFGSPGTCSTSDFATYQMIRCSFAPGAGPGTQTLVHVDLTARTEMYDASLTASAQTEFSIVSDAATLDVVRPGVTADVHPFGLTAPDPLFVGQAATIASQVAAGGTTTMGGVTATVDVGSGLRLDGATWGNARTACTVVASRATCAIGTLGGRGAVPVALAVTPTAITAASVTTFTVTSTTAEQQPDPAPDTLTLTRAVQAPVADLGVTIEVGPFGQTPTIGADLDVEVTVTNHGPASATAPVDVVYTVSGGYDVLDRFGCAVTGHTTASCRLTDGFGTPIGLASGASRTVALRLTPLITAGGGISASATSASTEPTPDAHPNQATAAIADAAPASDDLQLRSWNHDGQVATGLATRSDIVFENAGPSRSRGLRAVVTFPSSWTITAMSANVHATCTFSGATGACDMDEIDGGTLVVSVTAVPGVAGDGQTATARITTDYPDPDGPLTPSATFDVVDRPTLAVSGGVTVTEGGTAHLPLQLSHPFFQTVAVTCVTGSWTATGTAKGGTDYDDLQSTVTFAPGTTTATFDVATRQDQLDENGELLLVVCGNVQNATPADPDPVFGFQWSVVGIVDDDPPPQIVPGLVDQAEGAAATAKLPVRLSRKSALPITVHWQTENDTAVAPGDFTAASGTLTFQPGEDTKYVTVTIRDDRVKEPDELFEVACSNPTNATIGGIYGLGFIRLANDD